LFHGSGHQWLKLLVGLFDLNIADASKLARAASDIPWTFTMILYISRITICMGKMGHAKKKYISFALNRLRMNQCREGLDRSADNSVLAVMAA
jgi:hypothetical protein